MTRKVKPQFVILGVALCVFATVLIIVLYVMAVNESSTYSATPDSAETFQQNTETNSSDDNETNESTVPFPKSIEQIILDEGLKVDSIGNITDADGVLYKSVNGTIKILIDGNLYTISVAKIKEVNARSVATKPAESSNTQPEKQNPGENKSEENKNIQNKKRSNSDDQQHIFPEAQQPAQVFQKPTQTVGGNPAPAESNVKINYKSLTVSEGDVFSLTLYGADYAYWSVDNTSLIRVYEDNGSQCSFLGKKRGTTTVTATYNGNSYTCSVTIQ